MKAFILIICSLARTTYSMQEFDDKIACENAKTVIMELAKKNYNSVEIVCVPKNKSDLLNN